MFQTHKPTDLRVRCAWRCERGGRRLDNLVISFNLSE